MRIKKSLNSKIKSDTKNILPNKRKHSPFLSVLLLSTTFVAQAHGMMTDWPDMFESNKLHYTMALGPKILGYLDDQSLGRAAQVSNNCQELVNQVHDARYIQIALGKAELLSWILEATEAEPNEAARGWQVVKEILEDPGSQSKISSDLKSKLLKLQPRLLQPEDLVLKDGLHNFLSCSSPNKTHPALSPLIQVIEDLRALEQDLAQIQDRALAQVLTSLKHHYEHYVAKLLTPDADRAALIHSKVILSGEGLMDLKAHGVPSYRIGQDKALSLLSKDRYGLLLKKNALGSHAVSHQGRVHFKGNTTSTGLPVGMEAAAYWLAQVLFGRGMAPTALLTLNEVDMRTPPERTTARSDYGLAQATNLTSTDFFTSYPQHQSAFTVENPHHVVQASLHVEGISLEDFMKGVERGDYHYNDLDLNSFSEHIFMSLLTNPSDGTPGNFMVRTNKEPSRGAPYPIVGIDNDMAFGPPLVLTQTAKNTFKPCLEVKNVLLCLPLMEKPLSTETRRKILQTSPELILLRWLERLKIQLELYDQLKKKTYQKDNKAVPYLKEHIYAQELHLPLHLPHGLVSDLLDNFTKLQEKLRARPAITHEQLFSFLQPLAHRFYEALKNQYETPLSAYHFIHNSHHENIFLEDVLNPYKHETLISGKTVAQALEDVQLKDVQLKDVQLIESKKRQTLDKTAQEIWKNLDLNTQTRVSPLIELAATSFVFCFQDKASHHPSWFQDSLLCRALKEGVSDQGLSFLLALGLNIAVRDPLTQQNALHYAIAKKYLLPTLKLLLNSLGQEDQLNLLNGLDHRGLTLLDEAMEQDEEKTFCHLRTLGAINCNANVALKFYKRKVRPNSELHPAFRELMALNGEVEWAVTLEELLPPLTLKKGYKGVSLTSSTYGYLQVPDEIKSQILDQQNNFIQITVQGNHPVAFAHKRNPLRGFGLYFKLYPALPGLEEACGGLTRQLLGFGAPYTDLVKLGTFPCLISQEIPGDTLLKVLKTNPSILDHLDEEDISGMLIAAMLTNPEDGKPDNYIVTPHPTKPHKYRIVGIDNDQAFVPAIVKEKPDTATFTGKIRPIAQVKTVLYCLDQMKSPVDPNLRTRIINLHPDRFLETWLRVLKRTNNQHCGLFTGQEQAQVFQQQKCFIGVPFQQGAIRHLYEKFVQLHDLLTLHPNINHIDLLAKLEPRLARRYQAALINNISVGERFARVDRPFYEVKLDSKRGESHTTVTQSGDILQSMGIPLQEKIFESIRLGKENGPVQALEELETIKKEKNEDTLKSLAVRVGDINLLKTLTLEESRTLFLKELNKQKKILNPKEQMAILDYLSSQKGIRELPLPNFSAIDDFLFQKLSFEHLRILDLRKCIKITNESLIHLSKTALSLEELNLSYLTQLKEIGNIGVLTDAPLIFKALCFLNLSHCTNLEGIDIDVPKLKRLWADSAVKLKTIKMNSFELEGISCQGGAIEDQTLYDLLAQSPVLSQVNITNCPHITKTAKDVLTASLNDMVLSSLNLSEVKLGGLVRFILANNTTLKSLNLCGNKIGDEGVRIFAQNTNLTSLNLENNEIGDKGVEGLAKNTTLTSLNLAQNKLGDEGAEELAKNITLTSLNLAHNQVRDKGAEGLAKNITLTSLNLEYNAVGSKGAIALAQNNTLKSLNLYAYPNAGSRFTEAFSSVFIGNEDLYIGDTEAFVFAQNSAITSLKLGWNHIGDKGAVAFALNTTLKLLDLGGGRISDKGACALANNTTLTLLDLWGNRITDEGAIMLSRNTTLTYLGLFAHPSAEDSSLYNEIGNKGAIALATNTTLTSLDLIGNKIEDEGAVALAKNTTLTSLGLIGNKIGNTGTRAFSQNTTLTSLDLLMLKGNFWGNKIGDVVPTVKLNSNLTTLKWQKIDEDMLELSDTNQLQELCRSFEKVSCFNHNISYCREGLTWTRQLQELIDKRNIALNIPHIFAVESGKQINTVNEEIIEVNNGNDQHLLNKNAFQEEDTDQLQLISNELSRILNKHWSPNNNYQGKFLIQKLNELINIRKMREGRLY
ncbi:MAG: hypothetical protein H0X26_07805 [Alphaproteobacteria bacterium]|nr:hypothetical protein [Alphaproteobacteria bacterium]